MNSPRPKLRRDTRVFISAVTRELGSVRKLVKKGLEDNDYHAVEQDNFPTDYRQLVDKLRERIASCDAVVHIAGRCFGAEPSQRPDGVPRRSYTQFEYDLAVELGKPVYVFLTGDGFPADPHEPEDADRMRLQDAHRQRLTGTGQDYSRPSTREELDQKIRTLPLKVEALQEELTTVATHVTATGRSMNQTIAISVALVIVLVGGIGLFVARQARQQQEDVKAIPENVAKKTAEQVEQAQKKTVAELQKLFENPDVLTGTLKTHIRKRAEEEISKARKDKADWRKIGEIEKLRDQALDRVEDLVNTIREGLTGDPDPVFVEAARLLGEKGVQEAIDYLESKQSETLDQVDRLIDRQKEDEEKKRELLKRLHLEANLRETNLQWEKALKLYEIVAVKAPNWFEARNSLGKLHLTLARFIEAEPHLLAAVDLAVNSDEKATALNNLAQLFQATNRLVDAEPLMRRTLAIDEQSYPDEHPHVAIRLNNLAMLLYATNRLAEAEPLMRRALSINEKFDGVDHPSVAATLDNLAQLLQRTNHLEEAESMMRRALVIDEKVYGALHPNVAIRLSNVAMLLKVTNRLAIAELLMRRALVIDEQSYGEVHPNVATRLNNLGQLMDTTNRRTEAEPLMRRALAIDESFYGTKHSIVAIRLNNLATLLQNTNRLAAAELLMRRALAIDEQSYGAQHPSVARDLNNLAVLLKVTNRLAAAEPLMRRALQIDEQSYGPEHPDVALDLNNLGGLLKDTNRLKEAEPFYRRSLAIDELSLTPEHPKVAVRLNNLARLLQATNRRIEAEALMARALSILSIRLVKDHPNTIAVQNNYRKLLAEMTLPPGEVDQRVNAAMATMGPLKPIMPEVERVLGPATPVSDILVALDRQYKVDGKPAVYFLSLDQPIAPHIDELLKPSPDSLSTAGVIDFRSGAHADAILLYEESLKLQADDPDKVATTFNTRMNRAAALRELGDVEQARDELRLLSGLKEGDTIPALTKGRARYHLALCEWRLGDRDAAQREAEESLKAYGDDDAAVPQKKQTEQLLADLKDNKPLPPLAKVDPVAALEQARGRFRARADLAALPLNQSALPLLDQMLGPAKSTKEVFETLDRQYREQNKPEIWFLPLNKPIAPHLDELLGPVSKTEKEE